METTRIFVLYRAFHPLTGAHTGETGRNLSTRLKKHKTNCEKSKLDKSAVDHPAWTYDHRIKWNEATILANDKYTKSRKMRESIEIYKHQTID